MEKNNFNFASMEELKKNLHSCGESFIKAANNFKNDVKRLNPCEKEYEQLSLFSDGEKVCVATASDAEVIYETKESVKFIDLLNMLSDGKSLPRKIVYDDVIYTNVTRTNANLLYYAIDNEFTDEDESETSRIFKDVMRTRKPGETDIDILNREVGIIEW